jgi:hypothetical protein
MDELKTIITESFFTQPLMLICAIVAFIFSIIYRNKFQELRFIFFYPISSVIQSLFLYYSVLFDASMQLHLENLTASLFVVVEFVILYNFFFNVILLKNLRRLMKIIFLIFMLYTIIMWTYTNSFYNPNKTYLTQSLCILCFCFLYFFQLFKLPPKLDLINNPFFWITIGCLFYFSCTVPLFFIDNILVQLPNYYTFYSINYFAYSILFLLIAKSFLCNPPLAN